MQLFNVTGVVKSAGGDQIHRKLDLFQGGTAIERTAAHGGDTIIQHNRFQIGTAAEGTAADTGDPICYVDTLNTALIAVPGGVRYSVIIFHITGAGDLQKTAAIQHPLCFITAITGGNLRICQ